MANEATTNKSNFCIVCREYSQRDGGEDVSEPMAEVVRKEEATLVSKLEKDEFSLFHCKTCHEAFSTELEVRSHAKRVHINNLFVCKFCSEEVPRKFLEKHLKEAHDVVVSPSNKKRSRKKSKGVSSEADQGDRADEEPINPCEMLCTVEMKEIGSEGEKNVNLNFQGVECTICNQTYASEVNLKKHMYNVHKMARVKCNICDKVVNKKSLDRHIKRVHNAKMPSEKESKPKHGKRRIQCGLCDKTCSSVVNLENHMKNIHEAEQFSCSQCDFQGVRKQVEKHMKKQHSNEVFQCNKCQKILKSKTTLKEHMWIHTDHRRFICDICGMGFKRTSNYHGHLKSHQEKKFQCQLCGNFFLRRRYLAVHEQTIHNYYAEGDPPSAKGYQCEVCGVKLKWKNNLLAHMRIHTGEKPYKCKICGDDFTCHGSLRTHMAKHAICPAPSQVSNIVIQQTYLESRTETTVPFVPPAFGTSCDSVAQTS